MMTKIFNIHIFSVKFIATGWGRTDFYADRSNILLKVFLERFPIEECRKHYKVNRRNIRIPNGILDESQMCIGSYTERKDTCLVIINNKCNL